MADSTALISSNMHPDTNIVGTDGPLLRHRGTIIGILLLAVIAVQLPKYIVILYFSQGGVLLCALRALLCCQVLMAGFPFLLARIAPTLAAFDRQWLPSVWSQWRWFPVLVILLFIVYGLHDWLLSFRKDWLLIVVERQAVTNVAPVSVILLGGISILFGPIAEELFWRAFLLPQLGKLTRWPIALSIHSLLFSLAHIPNGWSVLVACFFYGTIFGIWRIRFRSLLPLVLAHMILNMFAYGPHLVAQYNAAVQSYPKCQEIDRLTREPVATAVPALIALMADRDEVVSLHALEVLRTNYRSEAEPYLAEALASSDNYTVDRALTAIAFGRYLGLKPQVRALAWSSEDVVIQISAVMTLRMIGDEEGLRDIVQKHPEERVRRATGMMVGEFQGLQEK
ncbi:MAG: CPBP family glutamic-type intramembrane protease [Pirellulaceae bacterium]